MKTKTIFITFIFILIATCGFAQWSASGSFGIGNAVPFKSADSRFVSAYSLSATANRHYGLVEFSFGVSFDALANEIPTSLFDGTGSRVVKTGYLGIPFKLGLNFADKWTVYPLVHAALTPCAVLYCQAPLALSERWNVALQYGGDIGGGYRINDTFAIEAAYSYRYAPMSCKDMSGLDAGMYDWNIHSVSVSLRYFLNK